MLASDIYIFIYILSRQSIQSAGTDWFACQVGNNALMRCQLLRTIGKIKLMFNINPRLSEHMNYKVAFLCAFLVSVNFLSKSNKICCYEA